MRNTIFASIILSIVIGCGLAPAAFALKIERQIPQNRAQQQLSFAPLIKEASPKVVNIYTKQVVTVQSGFSPLFNDPVFRQFFGNRLQGRTRKKVEGSLGSGVIVGQDGLIVTNYHVVKKSNEITVVLADKREFDATIIVSDEKTDLALLKIDTEGEKLPFLRFADSDDLEVGDLVLAIGNPFGVGQTVTSGIVSALARTTVGVSDYQFFIQTDAAINPGNSGGALIDMQGRLVGVNSAIFSRSGGSNGIGFAIPSNMVSATIRNSNQEGNVVRPWFGASMQRVTQDIALSLGLDKPQGVLVNDLYKKGPAMRAGIKVGDVILTIEGRVIEDEHALRYRIATYGLGRKVTITLLRKGKQFTRTIIMEAPPEHPKRNIRTLTEKHPLSGATIGNLSPAFAEELDMDVFAEGVVVTTVKRGTLARRFGVKVGDIILQVNDTKITTTDQLAQVLKEALLGWNITIYRNGKELSLRARR